MGGPSYDVDAQKNLTKKTGDDAENGSTETIVKPASDTAANDDGTKTGGAPAVTSDATQTGGAPVPKPTDKGSVASVYPCVTPEDDDPPEAA